MSIKLSLVASANEPFGAFIGGVFKGDSSGKNPNRKGVGFPNSISVVSAFGNEILGVSGIDPVGVKGPFSFKSADDDF